MNKVIDGIISTLAIGFGSIILFFIALFILIFMWIVVSVGILAAIFCLPVACIAACYKSWYAQ